MLLERHPQVEAAVLDRTTVLYDTRDDRYVLLEAPVALAWAALQAPLSADGLATTIATQLDLPEGEARTTAEAAVQDLLNLGLLTARAVRVEARPRYARVMGAAAFAAVFATMLAAVSGTAMAASSYGSAAP